MNIGFPEASVSFNRGQDILYRQFNDIDFYVEDTDKENLYFLILKNLLPGIKLSKIFPLSGKKNVISDAQSNSSSKRKVYLVDLDFDDILGRKQSIRNLIYLERYSIENYFFDEEAIKEQIREKKPSIKDAEINRSFSFNIELTNILHYLKNIALAAIVIQRYNLGISYPNHNFQDYMNYYNSGGTYSQSIIAFFNQVENGLKNIDGRFSLSAKLKNEKKFIRGCSLGNLIPGKWVLVLIKSLLLRRKLIIQKNDDSFSYSLAKDVNVKNLRFIANEITRIRG
jgi:hypothetical protein